MQRGKWKAEDAFWINPISKAMPKTSISCSDREGQRPLISIPLKGLLKNALQFSQGLWFDHCQLWKIHSYKRITVWELKGEA